MHRKVEKLLKSESSSVLDSPRPRTKFEEWIGERKVDVVATNAGAVALPFQAWLHFKEAFTPELVATAIKAAERPVVRCLDPFGGSGTTAITCQFLGVAPVTIEVNPYLADLIEAKLCDYNISVLARDLGKVVKSSAAPPSKISPGGAPLTLVEPGVDGRWVFDKDVAAQIFALSKAISRIRSKENKRLMRVLLGGLLVGLSNVRVSGKGRRYRNNWENRRVAASEVLKRFVASVQAAVKDISSFAGRPTKSYRVLRGDARKKARNIGPVDLIIFSPPYPNSFDYTDVYNLELWMLGYLKKRSDNSSLRRKTLTSHVQLSRKYAKAPEGSDSLAKALKELERQRAALWHRDIPAMVGAYFADLSRLMSTLQKRLKPEGKMYIVVGDSRYAGVTVPVAKILVQLAKNSKLKVDSCKRLRSMRSSAQQGGRRMLPESLLILSHLDA